MIDKENTTKTSTSDYIKAIIGAAIFLTAGILLTSKSINLNEKTATLFLQFFSLGLVIMAISVKGYYFDKPSNKDELPKKLLLFTVILIPTALVFLVKESYQELFFFISFFMSICIMLIYGLTIKRENYILTFLTSVWVLLGVIVFIKHYSLLPESFFNKLSFLHLDTIQVIRIVLLIGIGIHIIIMSFAEAIKHENKILESHPIPSVHIPIEIDNYHLLLRPFLWLVYLASLFLNIGIFIVNLILAGLRIVLDSVLRFGKQVVLSFVKLFHGWRSIIFFLLLYLVAFSIPFIISVNSTFLLSYIRGENFDFLTLLSQVGFLMLAVFVFRLIVTCQFCDEEEGGFLVLSNIIPILTTKAYIDNFIPTIYCVVFYSFFISLASLILTGLSNTWNTLLVIQGYSSIGILTKYCCYIVGAAIIMVIPLIIYQSKLAKKAQTEEKKYFVFTKLKWTYFWNKSWILLLFILLFFASYYYVNGAPYYWFHDKPKTTDSTSNKFIQNYIEPKKKTIDNLRNDSIKKSEQAAGKNEKPRKGSNEEKTKITQSTPIKENTSNKQNKELTKKNIQPQMEEPIYTPPSKTYNPYGEGNGRISVYTTCAFCLNMQVYVDDSFIGTLYSSHYSEPSCSASGVVSKNVKSGYHTIKTIDDEGNSLSRNIFIREGECNLQNFYRTNAYGNGNGRLIFWTNCSNCQWKIYVDGKYIGYTKYYTTTAPDCSASNCVYIDLPAGKHKCKAEISSQVWTGERIAKEGKCQLIKLSPTK